MKVAFYKSRKRLFNRLVCWKMAGSYSHAEAVFNVHKVDEYSGKVAYLTASSSFVDGGVRFTNIELNPTDWDVIDVPAFDDYTSEEWFKKHEGAPYDVRGLLSFILPFGHTEGGFFCDEAIMCSIKLPQAHRFDPNAFAAICEMLGGTWVQHPEYAPIMDLSVHVPQSIILME